MSGEGKVLCPTCAKGQKFEPGTKYKFCEKHKKEIADALKELAAASGEVFTTMGKGLERLGKQISEALEKAREEREKNG